MVGRDRLKVSVVDKALQRVAAVGHLQFRNGIGVFEAQNARHTSNVFEHVGFLDQLLKLVHAQNLALPRFVILIRLVQPLHKKLEHLKLLHKRLRVALDVDLLDHAAFARHWALAKEDLALGRVE